MLGALTSSLSWILMLGLEYAMQVPFSGYSGLKNATLGALASSLSWIVRSRDDMLGALAGSLSKIFRSRECHARSSHRFPFLDTQVYSMLR